MIVLYGLPVSRKRVGRLPVPVAPLLRSRTSWPVHRTASRDLAICGADRPAAPSRPVPGRPAHPLVARTARLGAGGTFRQIHKQGRMGLSDRHRRPWRRHRRRASRAPALPFPGGPRELRVCPRDARSPPIRTGRFGACCCPPRIASRSGRPTNPKRCWPRHKSWLAASYEEACS